MGERTAIFTICSNNYLAQTHVFFSSLRRFHDDADHFIALADVPSGAAEYPADVAVLPADDLDIPDVRSVAFRYDIMEFNTAIKPFAFLRLFALGYDRVLYFDPDIMLFRRLDDVLTVLGSGASLALTPHLCSPPDPGAARDEVDVMRTGVFNLGFLGAARHPETEPVLRWWARKLRYQCLNDQPGGIFVDQKFMDLVPGFTDHARILRDPTLNVAYWNIGQRRIDRSDETWTVDGRPLGFFHFSGYDPATPNVLSKHAPGAPVSEPLQALLNVYAGAMTRRRDARTLPYAFTRFASGTPVPDLLRRMFRDREPLWPGDPFDTYEDYARWPFSAAARGLRGEMVSNVMGYVHGRSEKLRARFDLAKPSDVSAFVRWFGAEAGHLGLADAQWRCPAGTVTKRDVMSPPVGGERGEEEFASPDANRRAAAR